MSSSDQTASFVLRFSQKLFLDEQGEEQVQWRGKITHVQGSDQQNFSDLGVAMKFMEDKLDELTLNAAANRSAEEKEGLLAKSKEIWNRMASTYPKMVANALKDPKAQVQQIQEQISSRAGEISSKIDLEAIKPTTKSDIKSVMTEISAMKDMLAAIQASLNTK